MNTLAFSNRLQELRQRARLALRILADRDGNLVRHAQTETAYLHKGDNGPDEWMARHLVDMARTFSSEGHNGFSAAYAVSSLERLLRFKPLRPLTGEPDEWVDVGTHEGVTTFQNKRCSSVFREGDGQAYNIEGVIFEEPNGACFTGRLSRAPVTFPYRPASVRAKVPYDATDEQKATAARDALAAAAGETQ